MPSASSNNVDRDTYGILVGWEHGEFAGKIDLQLQTAMTAGHLARGEVDTFHIVMTPQQAAVLGNYLFQVTGQTAPEKRRGLLRRWFA